jgi:para-nitrobenzyl esterase
MRSNPLRKGLLALGAALLTGSSLTTQADQANTEISSAAAPHVQLHEGRVRGTRVGGVDAFLGVPFAAPPVAANRWQAPQPPTPWSGERAADHFAPSCWQGVSPKGFGPWTHEYVVSGEVSEDCLYLNVWTPRTRRGLQPVLVWIYGGGFGSGSGSVPLYNGAALAARGIVVVNFNYRVGVLGFFAHPDLTAEAKAGGTPPGNYGLQDQVAALRWVRENIAAFGGDPTAVTIAGQSAGAMSVHALIHSPLAAGLFRGAIGESGLLSTLPLPALSQAEGAGQTFSSALHADSIQALRQLPPEKLAAPGGGLFSPIADGMLITDPGHAVLNDTALLIGMNTNDPGSFGPAAAPSAESVSKALHDSFGPFEGRFAELYPAKTPIEQAAALHDIARDRGLAALYAFSRERLTQSRKPLFVYLFNHTEPGPESARYGAFHSAELGYVFDTLDTAPERGFTSEDRELAQALSSYWLGFVRTGTPATAGLPKWPAMRIDAPVMMQFDSRPDPRPLLPAPKLEATKAFLAAGGKPRLF